MAIRLAVAGGWPSGGEKEREAQATSKDSEAGLQEKVKKEGARRGEKKERALAFVVFTIGVRKHYTCSISLRITLPFSSSDIL